MSYFPNYTDYIFNLIFPEEVAQRLSNAGMTNKPKFISRKKKPEPPPLEKIECYVYMFIQNCELNVEFLNVLGRPLLKYKYDVMDTEIDGLVSLNKITVVEIIPRLQWLEEHFPPFRLIDLISRDDIVWVDTEHDGTKASTPARILRRLHATRSFIDLTHPETSRTTPDHGSPHEDRRGEKIIRTINMEGLSGEVPVMALDLPPTKRTTILVEIQLPPTVH